MRDGVRRDLLMEFLAPADWGTFETISVVSSHLPSAIRYLTPVLSRYGLEDNTGGLDGIQIELFAKGVRDLDPHVKKLILAA